MATKSRKYIQTHPWITFTLNLERAPWPMWVRLGEAASKCVHLSNVPLRPDTAKKLHELYLAKGAAATTAIEGNTLSEAQVLRHVQGELALPPTQQYLQREIDNVITAFNQITSALASNQPPQITTALIQQYNRQVRQDLPEPAGISGPGILRSESVIVGNIYRAAPAEDCPYLLDRLSSWLNSADFDPHDGYALPFTILKAVVAHIYLAWIHPFGDGNGRTARLVEFHILLAAGIPQPAVHLLSNHYNQTRQDYYRHLDHASKFGGDILPFLNYAIAGFVDGLRSQLETVWDQQWDVAWQNYVHEIFRGKDTKTATRQRQLALDLGTRRDAIPINSIDELTPRLAKAYAGKTKKTLSRDLNALESLNLIERNDGRARARREIILSFLPLTRRN